MAGLQLNPKTGAYEMTYSQPGYGAGRPAPAPAPAGLFTSAYQGAMAPSQSAPDINRSEQDFGTGAIDKGMQTLADYNNLEGITASEYTPSAPPTQGGEITAAEWDTAQNASADEATGAMSMENMQAIKSILDQTSSAANQEGVGPGAKVGGAIGTAGGSAVGMYFGGPQGAAIGGAIGGATLGTAGMLLDFVMQAESTAKATVDADNRARVLRQFEQQALAANSLAERRNETAFSRQQKAETAKRMSDMLSSYIGRKTAKLTRKGLNAPGAPVQPYNTTTYRAGLAGGMF